MARVRDKVIDTLWLLFLPLKQAQLPSSSQVPPPAPPLEPISVAQCPGRPALLTTLYCPYSMPTAVLHSEQSSYRTWDPEDLEHI